MPGDLIYLLTAAYSLNLVSYLGENQGCLLINFLTALNWLSSLHPFYRGMTEVDYPKAIYQVLCQAGISVHIDI